MWALLNPMLLMIVLTVVFSTIMGGGIPHYAIFLLSVLLPWTFFSQSLSYAAESIVGNGDLIKKVRVPKLIFPVAAVVSNMINFLLSLIPLVLIVLVVGQPFYVTWLYLPVPLLALTIFTLRRNVLLRCRKRLLPGRLSYSANLAAGVVLCDAYHLPDNVVPGPLPMAF